MASKNRRSIIKKEQDRHDYEYVTKDGTRYNKEDAANIILDILDLKPSTMPELEAKTGFSEQNTLNLIKVLRDHNLVINTKLRRDNKYIYKTYNDCLLAQVLYPSPEEVVKQFKVKNVTTRTVQDGTSKGSGSNQEVTYADSYYNSVHWGE